MLGCPRGRHILWSLVVHPSQLSGFLTSSSLVGSYQFSHGDLPCRYCYYCDCLFISHNLTFACNCGRKLIGPSIKCMLHSDPHIYLMRSHFRYYNVYFLLLSHKISKVR